MKTPYFKTLALGALPEPAGPVPQRTSRPYRKPNSHLIINLLLPTAVLLGFAMTGRAQSFSVPWFKIAGGGGTVTNAQYTLSGTIGQHDAGGPMTNGAFTVSGGFWTALHLPSAPILKITPASPGYLTISWSPNAPCWRLQETISLADGTWVDSSSGTANPVTVPASSPAKFYRLIHP